MEPEIDLAWIDGQGQLFCDRVLRRISKSWTAEQWEQFLVATVERIPPDDEVQFAHYATLIEERSESVWAFYGPLPECVQIQVKTVILQLSDKKRKIIFGNYWFEFTLRKLSKLLGLHLSKVFRTRASALSEIKAHLEIDRNTVSYLIGGSANLTFRERSRSEQIAHVYRQDLNGSYTK